ncbi:MAG: aminotransferase class III-fold pyridoxal phosphate-dependent enzyme [Opitutaceae bacterium]
MNPPTIIPPSSGARLWQKAKGIIPGGNQLLSKRAERFLPDLWPAYYKKAKGCEVWDLDGTHFYDFAQMGVGSCILGYADDDVDNAVVDCIRAGSMTTLNSYEEVEFAELILSLHPWAQKARFARSGGEACSIAVRIARAAAGKDGVAFCGYHGWHDWYLAANLADAGNLDGQLMPGLAPAGVPRHLQGTAVPFHFNDLGSLERAVAANGGRLGAIIMEPERGSKPTPEFLAGVRAIATKIGAVLIFDEVTSGFRLNVGGIHLTQGVEPDIAVLGKGMSNGYPMAAIIGRASVMEAAQDSFISSTFWTERIGFTAALAAIRKMQLCDVSQHLCVHGQQIIAGLRELAARQGIPLSITGIDPLIYLAFQVGKPLEAQTFWAQEMLARGYLLGGAIYTTYAYTPAIIDQFLAECDPVFARLRTHLDQGDLATQLKGRVIQPGFRRLT